MSYINFIKKHITLTVLISVTVFNLFSNLHDKILSPLLNYIVLDNLSLDKFNFTLKDMTIKYGLFIKDVLYTIILLTMFYIIS